VPDKKKFDYKNLEKNVRAEPSDHIGWLKRIFDKQTELEKRFEAKEALDAQRHAELL
jgi:hypothetical protein